MATVLNITKPATPANPTTGQTLINMIRDLVRAHETADNHSKIDTIRCDRMNASCVGYDTLISATALIPIESVIEALAQVIFLDNEISHLLDTFVDPDETHEPHIRVALQALRARPVLIAKWLEQQFGIDREDYSLDFFSSDELGRKHHLPHLAELAAE